MIKTPEQWAALSPKHIAEFAWAHEVLLLVEAAQADIAELLRDKAQLQFALEQSEQKYLEALQPWCGEPYVHDCGNPRCPTSDSYDKTLGRVGAGVAS